jgi:hypothetical protein
MLQSESSEHPIAQSNHALKSEQFPFVEGAVVLLILLAFIAVNFAASLALQPVWLDEITVADPAVNLYFGKGFTSTGWQYQTKEEFWASNAPLHQILLYHWIMIFGFNPTSVRSISFVLMAITIALIWFAVYQLKLISSIQGRLALVALLICGAGTTFNYVGGRYDCIGITLFAAAFLSYAIPLLWVRTLTFLCIGILIPIAGVNLIPYGLILGALLLLFLRGKFIREAVSIGTGTGIGILFLYVLYATNGVAKVILTSAGGHGLSNALGSYGGEIGKADFATKIKFVITHLPQILGIRLMNLPGWFLMDPSFVALLLLLIGFAVYQYRIKKLKFRSVTSFGLIIAIVVPIALGILRDYPFYYSWLAYIPLAICTMAAIDELWTHNRNAIGRLIAIAVVVFACIPGLPAKLVASTRDGSWNRNYAEVEQFVEANVQKTDKVYSDFEAYYPAKRKAEYVLLPTYKDVMSDKEKQELSMLIVKPESYAAISNFVGGKWVKSANLLAPEPYSLEIYRRDAAKSSSAS